MTIRLPKLTALLIALSGAAFITAARQSPPSTPVKLMEGAQWAVPQAFDYQVERFPGYSLEGEDCTVQLYQRDGWTWKSVDNCNPANSWRVM